MNNKKKGKSDTIILMVEPRKTENFDIVFSTLPKDLVVYFFGTKGNEVHVKNKAKQHGLKLKFQYIPDTFMSSPTYVNYNAFFKSEMLWLALDDAEWVFIAQTDMALCDKLKQDTSEILKFTQFPYIGCAYGEDEGQNTFWKKTYKGASFYGVGGMSLRNRAFTLECIRKYPHETPEGKDIPEDVFFSTCLEKSEWKKPSTKDMHQFCIESDYSDSFMHDAPIGPLGVHKPHLIHKPHRKKLHAKCPIAFQLEQDAQSKSEHYSEDWEDWDDAFNKGGWSFVIFFLSSWIIFALFHSLFKYNAILSLIISYVYFGVGTYFFVA